MRLEVPITEDSGVAISGTLFVPALSWRNPLTTLVIAVPGGSYDRSYWHLMVPGLDGYSFAEKMVDSGYMVFALDNLGTGSSHRPTDPTTVTVETMADAVSMTARRLATMIAEGMLGPRERPARVRLIVVGHSLGAQIAVAAQARNETFEAVGVFGGSFISANPGDIAGDIANARTGLGLITQNSIDDGYLNLSRDLVRGLFHADDVPDAVMTEEARHATVMPLAAAIQALAPVTIAEYPRRVAVPVFLAFGDVDTSPDPDGESRLYARSPTVASFRVAGSAHCHNASSNRHLLWTAWLAWLETLHGR